MKPTKPKPSGTPGAAPKRGSPNLQEIADLYAKPRVFVERAPWETWGLDSTTDSTKEVAMTPAARSSIPKISRKVEWRSPDGKWVVVRGPFPNGFFRSETRKDPVKASMMKTHYIVNRPETETEDSYAKVLASDIVEILGGENEFGPVSP